MSTIVSYLQVAFEIWSSNDRYETAQKENIETFYGRNYFLAPI